jgi:cytochrome c
MKTPLLALAAALALAAPSLAQDIAAGERAYAQCAACHVVQNAAGEILAGRAGRQGPNLYGMAGRVAGAYAGFRFSRALTEAGEKGLVWEEASFVAYVLNPNQFLRDYLGDPRARGNMALRVRSEQEARDLWAFITSLTPPPADAGG